MLLSPRQTEIVDAALALTASGGISGLTMKKLSAAIGVTEAAIYRHFRSKSEIIKAMIGIFDTIDGERGARSGFAAVAAFIEVRLARVAAKPELARVIFSEELFMDEPEFSTLMAEMMQHHRKEITIHFAEAREAGEIRAGLSDEQLFLLVMGPVRLLIRQWGMANGAFDLQARGAELIGTLREVLRPGAG